MSTSRVLHKALFANRERELVQRVDAATLELVHKIDLIEEQRALIALLTYSMLEV